MNWIVFLIGAWLMFGLETGLRDGLLLGPTGAAPSFVMIYIVFISLSAPKRTALWASIALGIMLDLTRATPAADGLSVVWTIGPMALGAALASYTTVMVRGVLYQRNPLAAPIVVFAASFLAWLVVIGVFTARSWYDPTVDFAPMSTLARDFVSALYTAVAALALGLLLRPILGVMSSLYLFDPTPSAWRWGSVHRMSSIR